MPDCFRRYLVLAAAALLFGATLSIFPGTAGAVPVGGFFKTHITAKSKASAKRAYDFWRKADKKTKHRLKRDRFDRDDESGWFRKDIKTRRRHVKHQFTGGKKLPSQPANVQPAVTQPSVIQPSGVQPAIIQPASQLLQVAPATLTGDFVVITERSLLADNGGVGPFTFSGIVGPGPDTNSPAPYSYDLNFGLDGNQFQLVSTEEHCAYITKSCAPAPFSITFSDLNFSDGAELVDIASLVSVFPNTTFTLLENSVTFFMTDTRHLPGVLLSGTFVTRTLVAVPLPAAGALLAFGIAGLSFLSWRRGRNGSISWKVV